MKDNLKKDKKNTELAEVSTSRGTDYQQIEENIVIKDATENPNEVEDFRMLKIAIHNINEIKDNSVKLESLLEQTKKNNIDIVRINETNTIKRQNYFSINKQKEYKGIQIYAEENKKKGSGVSLLINRKQEKHLS